VLAGVGGRTIHEAKHRMSLHEAMAWQAYMRKYGLLNIGPRLEQGFAMLAAQINRALGGKAKVTDFMPHFQPAPARIEEVFAMMQAATRNKKHGK